MVNLMNMYSEMGDRIALQYGGSEAHNKMRAGEPIEKELSVGLVLPQF